MRIESRSAALANSMRGAGAPANIAAKRVNHLVFCHTRRTCLIQYFNGVCASPRSARSAR